MKVNWQRHGHIRERCALAALEGKVDEFQLIGEVIIDCIAPQQQGPLSSAAVSIDEEPDTEQTLDFAEYMDDGIDPLEWRL